MGHPVLLLHKINFDRHKMSYVRGPRALGLILLIEITHLFALSADVL